MLEKNEKNMQNYYDAHFHYSVCKTDGAFNITDIYNDDNVITNKNVIIGQNNVIIGLDPIISPSSWQGLSCAHSITEWKTQYEDTQKYNLGIAHSFGLHPQSAGWIDIEQNAAFLEQLINEKKVSAIGEAGFDYFSDEFRDKKDIQEKMWNIQLELAISAQLPIIVHCRKANEKLFEYSKKLKLVPAVLFHSFMGTPVEALSLCRRGINAYFSFGKQLMNNNKKTIACMSELPLETLLCETDAPFQFLKGENHTKLSDIKTIYKAAFTLRKDCTSFEDFQLKLEQNYNHLVCSFASCKTASESRIN